MFVDLGLLFKLIRHTLMIDQRAWEVVFTHPQSGRLIISLVFIAGFSTLVGESVVLFINQVRKSRLILSLVINGFVTVIGYMLWGLVIGLVGWLLFPIEPQPLAVLRLVGLSAAPLVFGFLILIPYLGTAIGKLIHVWSFIILISVVRYRYEVDLLLAVVTVGLGWLLMMLLTNTIGRPIIRLRQKIWKLTAGDHFYQSAQDLFRDLSIKHQDGSNQKNK